MKTTQPRDIPRFLNSSKPVYTHTQYQKPLEEEGKQIRKGKGGKNKL